MAPSALTRQTNKQFKEYSHIFTIILVPIGDLLGSIIIFVEG
jgi:hypothetical protein